MIKKYFILLMIVPHWIFSQNLFIVQSSQVKFTSDAPLELIEASSDKLQGILNINDRSFAFRAPMKSFDGFNSSIQKTHFNINYLETNAHPYTSFEGKIIEDVDFSKPGVYNVRAKGNFTCHGIETERIIKCELIIAASEIKVKSDFTVLLEDHNIKIPSVVHQKIAEEILVDLKAVLTPKR